MANRNDRGQHSDEYRPFDDPKHPSWYTDPSAPEGPATPPHAGGAPAARNPYADQPLAGPYSDGQPQYPIHGGYPVVANPSGQRHPGQNPYDVNHGQPGPYGQGGMQPGRTAGTPYPGGQARSAGLGVTAMVLGIAGVVTFGFLFVPQILAIVFGHISLSKEPHGKGFAVAGLIMGYLVTGLWTLMIIGLTVFGAVLG